MLPTVTWPHSDVATTDMLPTVTGYHSDMATIGLLLIVTWTPLTCCTLCHDLTVTATTDLLPTVTWPPS